MRDVSDKTAELIMFCLWDETQEKLLPVKVESRHTKFNLRCSRFVFATDAPIFPMGKQLRIIIYTRLSLFLSSFRGTL